MRRHDLEPVSLLEQRYGDVRWTQEQLQAEWQKPISRYVVAVESVSQAIVGYAGGWVVAPEIQIANIVIAPEARCQGIGRRLLDTLLETARQEGCGKALLEVRRSNAHAQALYRSAGFKVSGTRPNFYSHPPDDAVLMEKEWT